MTDRALPCATALALLMMSAASAAGQDGARPEGIGSDLIAVTDGGVPPEESPGGPPDEAATQDAPPDAAGPRIVMEQDPATGAAVRADVNETGTNADPVPTEQVTDTPAPEENRPDATGTVEVATPESTTATAVRGLLTDLWRDAVAAGETTLGFEVWLAETLGVGTGAAPATDSPDASLPGDQAGRTRAVSERWLARAGPVALGEAGRVVTVFGAAIPTAFCSPLTVCVIELEPGEVLTDAPSWGDAVRWQVVAKKQGAGTVLLEVKPAEDAAITNLVIPTDRRLYTIRLVNDAGVHTPILAFSYPDTVARRAEAAIAAREVGETAAAEAGATASAAAAAVRRDELDRSGVETERGRVPASELDLGFRVDGRAPFRPVRVFADSAKTYIDLPPRYRGALPAIVAGPGETNAALNTRVGENGTRLIADRVIADIWLQSGKTRVRIRRGP